METGFDRGIDFEPMKEALIKEFKIQLDKFQHSGFFKRSSKAIIFLLIEMIQLRNGCRITEAINAFKKFIKKKTIDKVKVKICKSEAKKKVYVKGEIKDTKVLKEIMTKPRFREIMFPTSWLEGCHCNIKKLMTNVHGHNEGLLEKEDLGKAICKYMMRRFKSNTHSLRYAFINYLLFVEEKPMAVVAKFVGHRNTNQLVTYTQQKNCEERYSNWTSEDDKFISK